MEAVRILLALIGFGMICYGLARVYVSLLDRAVAGAVQERLDAQVDADLEEDREAHAKLEEQERVRRRREKEHNIAVQRQVSQRILPIEVRVPGQIVNNDPLSRANPQSAQNLDRFLNTPSEFIVPELRPPEEP